MLLSDGDFGSDIYPNDDRARRTMLRFAGAFIGTASLGICSALIRPYRACSSETQLTKKKKMVVVSKHVSVTCVSCDHNCSSSSDD